MFNFFNKNFKNATSADLYEQGLADQRSGNFKAAVQAFLKAIEADPAFVEAYNSLGLTFKKMRDFDNAIKYYNQGIEIYFQNIYNEIKAKPIRKNDNQYLKTKSLTWMEVSGQIAVKNNARDGIKTIKFPTGENAEKMTEEVSGPVFRDEGNTRYILPSYFSAFYEALKSNLLYSILANNAGTAFAESGDGKQAKKCYQESIAFIPEGVKYDDPTLGLKELNLSDDDVQDKESEEMENTDEKSYIAKISDKLEKLADSKGKIVCRKCGEVAAFFGIKGNCSKCDESFNDIHQVDQLSLSLEFLYIFIDECDESLSSNKEVILNALTHYKEKIKKTNASLSEQDITALKKLIRSLGQIGGNECGAAIQIPKEGKFTIAMREENGMASRDAAELIVKIFLALSFIDHL